MNKQEKIILDYLNQSYVGARMSEDIGCMVRLERAIAAFSVDPEEFPEVPFTEEFEQYYQNQKISSMCEDAKEAVRRLQNEKS